MHGKCSHFYCGKCMKKNASVDALEKSCKKRKNFNPYEYRGYVKKYVKK